MYQIIGEQISVAGVYTTGKFAPKKFSWRNQTFPIQEICSIHNFRDGSVHKRRFSVMANHNLYLIEFNRDTEIWTLEQVWAEE